MHRGLVVSFVTLVAAGCGAEVINAGGNGDGGGGQASIDSGGNGGRTDSDAGVGDVRNGGRDATSDTRTAWEGAATKDSASTATDVPLPPLDAALASLDAAPAGLAGFAFIVNDVVQHPLKCAGLNWEYPPYPGTTSIPSGCMPSKGKACPGIESVILVNTGALDMAYIAGPWWTGENYVPGGYPGGDYKAGVLAPGAYVDITLFYNSGDVAIVGSALPFSSPDSGYASDEGTIPWPLGVAGSGGATTMYVAEIEVRTSCQPVQQNW